VLFAEGVEQEAVHAFEADGFVGEELGDVIGCDENVFEAYADERAARWTLHEAQRGSEDNGAGAFAADERAGYVEVVFGEELVEIKAGDAAWDVGELGADGAA
jgi:hypothetical protein